MTRGNVIFAAYTGKAAHELEKKGCHGALTLHRCMYVPRKKSSERLKELEEKLKEDKAAGKGPEWLADLESLIKQEKENLKSPAFDINPEAPANSADLLIVDEVSMVGDQMGKDLEAFKVPILVLGDTAQLPPVKGSGYFTNVIPDYELTEIHRQASHSPVLELATKIRNNLLPRSGDYGSSLVCGRGRHSVKDLLSYDQVICGRNATRRKINDMVRHDALGIQDPLPVPDDKVICTRNNYDLGLLNGSIWKVREAMALDEGYVALTVVNEDTGEEVETAAHQGPFLGQEVPFWEREDADEFDYAYAITCHKSQGSQFGSVYVVDEGPVFGQHRFRWLYTAVTRAVDRVTIVQ